MAKNVERRNGVILAAASIIALPSLWFGGWISNLPSREPGLDPRVLSDSSGISGVFDSNQVFRVSNSRRLPQVSINGKVIPEQFSAISWAAVTGSQKHAVMTGDVPVLEGEVNPVLRLALDSGLRVSALHNRFLSDNPRILSLHFSFVGPQEKVGEALGRFWGSLPASPASNQRFLNSLTVTSDFPSHRLTEAEAKKVRWWRGSLQNGIYRVSLPYGTTLAKEPLTDSMGASSWAMFAGSEKNAVVNGEIAIVEQELTPILRVLLQEDLQIVSIHEHFSQEVPKLSFVHFVGTGPLEHLGERVWKAAQEYNRFMSK